MIKLTCCMPRVFDNTLCGLTRVLGCVEVQIVKDRIGQVGVEYFWIKAPRIFRILYYLTIGTVPAARFQMP